MEGSSTESDNLMTEQSLKRQIVQHCLTIIAQQIGLAEAAIKQAQLTANNESKSSAGDKHETARALAHLEQERHAQVLRENLRRQQILLKLDPTSQHHWVQLGSLIRTNQGWFFVAISMGTIKLHGTPYRSISLDSPLGQALQEAELDEEISFRNKEFVIEAIY